MGAVRTGAGRVFSQLDSAPRVNALAQFGVLVHLAPGDSRAAVFAWFTPDRYVQLIWIPIYALLAIWLIRIGNGRRKAKRLGRTPFTLLGLLFIVTACVEIGWVFAWHNQNYPSAISLVLIQTGPQGDESEDPVTEPVAREAGEREQEHDHHNRGDGLCGHGDGAVLRHVVGGGAGDVGHAFHERVTERGDGLQRVDHGFGPLYDDASRILFLGTMASPASRSQGFFYMHPRNRFWPVMEALFADPGDPTDHVGTSVPSRRAFALRHHIALWDADHHMRCVGLRPASSTTGVR